MVTWDDAIQDCQDMSSDTGATALTFFKRMMNVAYKILLVELNRPTQELTMTTSTRTLSIPPADSDRRYMLPNDAIWPKSVTILNGTQKIPLVEEESQEMWDYRTQFVTTGIPALYFVRPRFGLGGTQILLEPIPTAGLTLTAVYDASDKDLSQAAYTTGSATVAYGSASVVGSGTAWTNAMIGRYWKSTDGTSDGQWYRISDVTSSTALTLENAYQGAINQSAKNYTINEAFALPDDAIQMLPVYWALLNYFAGIKKDTATASIYEKLYESGLTAGKARWAKKTDNSSNIRSKGISRWRQYPSWFPSSGISS